MEYEDIPDIDYTQGFLICLQDMHHKLSYVHGMIGAVIIPTKIKASQATIANLWDKTLRLSEIKYISYAEIQKWSMLQPAEDNSVPDGKLYLEDGWAVDKYRKSNDKGGETNVTRTND